MTREGETEEERRQRRRAVEELIGEDPHNCDLHRAKGDHDVRLCRYWYCPDKR